MDKFSSQRDKMVEDQLRSRGISDENVLKAFRSTPREHFVPQELKSHSYEDRALPLGVEQSISQPYVVALALQELDLDPNHTVLEIGSGSGYALALLSNLANEVHGIEVDPKLVEFSASKLKQLNIKNVRVSCHNGFSQLPFQKTFDRILISFACGEIPRSVMKLLDPESGIMILPLQMDESSQALIKLYRKDGELHEKELIPVGFVRAVTPDESS